MGIFSFAEIPVFDLVILRVTIKKGHSQRVSFFYAVIPSGSTHPENLRFSGYGFAFAARRSASLFARRRASKYSPQRNSRTGSAQNTPAHRIVPSAFVSHIIGSASLRGSNTLASICSQRGTSLHEKQLSTVFPSLSYKNPDRLDALGIFLL